MSSSKNSGLWLILLVIAAFLIVPKMELFSTFEVTQPRLIQYAGFFDGERFGGESWTLNYPYPLATESSEVSFFDYRIVTGREGGSKNIPVYGEPKCLPNTCSGVQTGTDEHECPVYDGETGTGSSWSESGYSMTCGGDRSGCTRFVTSRQGCGGGNCVTTSSNDCQSAGGDLCTIYCSGTCYTPTTCGGWGSEVIGTESGRGCWGTYTIYKGDSLINTVGPTRNKIIQDLNSELQVSFNTFNRPSETQLDCFRIENEFVIKPPVELLGFGAEAESATVSQGDVINARILVNNSWLPMSGILRVTFGTPTIVGEKTSVEVRKVDIPVGSSVHTFSIPTSTPTASLSVTPTLDLMFAGSTFSNINGNTLSCFNNDGSLKYESANKFVALTSCPLVKVGTFKQDKFTVVVLSETEGLISQILLLERNITFLQSTLAEKAETLKGLQLTLDEYSEVINKLQLEVDEKAGLMRELELTVEEYSEVIRKLELRVADEAAIANQLELDLAQMVNLTNGLQLRLDEQLIFLNNLNLNLAAKEALVRQLRITNAEQEALLSQMRGSFAEQAAILDGLNLTLQDDARQINGLELSLQAQGGIIDALRLNLSDMQELISFLKLSNTEKVELITSLNLTIQEQQRLLDALKLTPVLEVERLCESTGGVWSSSKGCDCIPVPDQSGTPVFVTGKGCQTIVDTGGAPIFGGIDNKLLLWIGGIIGGLILLRRLL